MCFNRSYMICLLSAILMRADISFAQTPILFGLTKDGGNNNRGTIIKINGDGSGFSVVHYFDVATGYDPVGTLMYANGILIGITAHGGANNYGTIFSLDPHTNLYSVLYDFDPLTGSFAFFDNFPHLLQR